MGNTSFGFADDYSIVEMKAKYEEEKMKCEE